jgi:putative membrane protein
VRRRRPSIYDEGTDPDYRFSLANERTFLAWNRTALALLAGGLAVVHLLPEIEPWIRRLLGVPPVILGGLIGALSYQRWEANERAMRRGERLPTSVAPRLLALAVALGAVVIVALVLLAPAPRT